jgi:hypothetical protein
MKMKAATRKKNRKKVAQTNSATRARRLPVISVYRRSPSEFSCGLDLERALLVEESLDERERRG